MATLAELDALVDANSDAFSGIAAAYEVLLGGVPSIDGFVFLINNAKSTNFGSNNPNVSFNQENIFINLTNALVQGNPAALAKFQAITQGASTLSDKLGAIYDAYVPSANQTAEGRAFFTRAEAQTFYANVAAERGVAGPDGAAIVGLASLLKILVTEDQGLGDAVNDLKAAINDGSAVLPTNGAVFTPIETADGTKFDQDDPDTGVRLTEGTDVVSGNEFNAPRGFTPGGTDQVNTLNDDDVLTGTGENPTLNFTFVDDADTNDTSVAPTLNGVETLNVDVRLSSEGTFDLQDATGVKNINLAGIDDDDFTVDNIGSTKDLALSITNSSAGDSSINFFFDDEALEDTANVVGLALNDVDVESIVLADEDFEAGLGIETLNLSSKGGNSDIGSISVEDAEAITLVGDADLTLGELNQRIGKNGIVEAESRDNGLANVAGSLKSFDASTFTGDLDIAFGGEVVATADDTSGVPVDFTFKGGSGNDTIRLNEGLDKGDSFDGGTGDNTVILFDSAEEGSITNVQHLRVEHGIGTPIVVDTSILPQLKDVTVRNIEVGAAVTVLKNLTAEVALNLTAEHAVSNGNATGENIIAAILKDQSGASDTVALRIEDAVNSDPRFNLTLQTSKVENIKIDDADTESNTVLLGADATNAKDPVGGSVTDITGTLTIVGGRDGTFLNLDASGNLYNVDQSGDNVPDPFALGSATESTVDSKASVQELGAAERFNAKTIDASTFVGDLIVRVSDSADAAGVFTANGAQNITLGAGDDTVIFDRLDSATAGLTISDVVKGGEGDDTLAIDGEVSKITIGASEWTNVSGFETIRLISATADNDAAEDYGFNEYNLKLTNELLAANGVASGAGRIINIVNDNDAANDAVGKGDTAGTADEGGVTIDARALSPNNSFTYNGEEETAAGGSADRFILADANVNGMAVIDGGAVNVAGDFTGVATGNGDVLEIRNAAVVTIGDLANVSNVGTLEFVNDLATVQTSVLTLDTATIDRLVNSLHAASTTEVENLIINVEGNPLVGGASTSLSIDATGVDFTKTTFTVNQGVGDTVVTVNNASGPVIYNFGVAGDGSDTVVVTSTSGPAITVNGFDTAQDFIGIGGALRTAIDDTAVDGSINWFSTNAANADNENVDLNVVEAIFVDDNAANALTTAELSDPSFAAVLAELNSEINLAGGVQDALIGIVSSTTFQTAFYYFNNANGNANFDIGELTLLGVANSFPPDLAPADFVLV